MMKILRSLVALALLALPTSALAFGVSGNVYCDVDGGGQIDAGDAPLGGVTVLVAQDSRVESDVTDADGAYAVDRLQAGLWDLSIDPASLNPGASVVVSPGTVELTLDAAFQRGLDFLVDDPACRDAFCGDGILGPNEECDDGNNEDGDGCSAECTIEPFCGDGILDPNEACDDGNNIDGDGCSADCMIEPFCGDGDLDPGEQCDDGNNEDGDGCSAFCEIEGGDDGCTPGYWKQPHHFDSYPAPYSPDTPFVDAFGIDAFPGKTLSQVAALKGGGLKALGRHSVAALLNAASPDVDYARTVDEVISSFEAAYDSGEYEYLKDMFDHYNNRGCPLN